MHIKFDKKWRCKSSCVYVDPCHMSRWLSSLIFCYLIWILIQRLALSTLKNVSTVLNVYLRIEMLDKYRKIKFQLKSNQFMKTLFFCKIDTEYICTLEIVCSFTKNYEYTNKKMKYKHSINHWVVDQIKQE